MTTEKTFFIDTTPDIFATWLQKHTALVPYADFPTEKGRLCLDRARLDPGGRTLSMTSTYVAPDPADEAGEVLYIGGTAIFFEMLPLSEGRLEVRAECRQPAALPYFEELLRNVGTRWPESGLVQAEPREQEPSEPGPTVPASEAEAATNGRQDRNYGPTEKVIERAAAAKRLKDADPTRSMMHVAMELGETPDAIRYAYRVMGWKWERADRVRINR